MWSYTLHIFLFQTKKLMTDKIIWWWVDPDFWTWSLKRQDIKKQRYYFADKAPNCQSYDFSNSHIRLWDVDDKKHWAPKNWYFLTVVLEKTLENPLGSMEIKPANPKGNQSWIFIGRTDAEAEAPILWPPNAKNWITGKDPDAGKDWGQEEKGMTKDEKVGWHHWFNGHELDQTQEIVKDR